MLKIEMTTEQADALLNLLGSVSCASGAEIFLQFKAAGEAAFARLKQEQEKASASVAETAGNVDQN